MEWKTKYHEENSEHAFNQIITVRPDGHLDVGTPNELKTRTQQQFKEECDINNIIKKYNTTGEFTHLSKRIGSYQDFSELGDYQSMLHKISEAESAFMELPATTRARFQNDPGQLMEFLQNDQNYDEGVKLGLIEPKNPNLNQNQNETQNETKIKTKIKNSTTEETQT